MKAKEPKTKAFQKNKEDFVCERCDALVQGDGYRDHCYSCLASKHVDVNPGDRAEKCGGLMSVVDVMLDHGELILIHECEKCGHQKKNKAHPEDSIDSIVDLMAKAAKKK